MRALILLLGVSVLAACGGGTLSPREALSQAQENTAKVDTARFTISGRTTVSGAGEIAFEGAGEFDAAARRVHLTMDMAQAGEIELVMDGFVMYMRMELLQQHAPQLKPWVELDLQKVGEEVGLDFEALMQLGRQQDPTAALEQLRAAGEVEELGEEEVRGVGTTHYRTTIDVERYVELVEDPKAAESIRRVMELTGQGSIPMEIWVDEDQLVRRLEWTQSVRAGGQQATTTMTIELSDFGAEVAIEPPPSDQVTPFEELLELTP